MREIIFAILFFTGFVCAIEADLDCPRYVNVDEEFTCEVFVEGIEGTYDLKVEIEDEGKTVAKIFNPSEEKWQSAYYYLKEFIEDSEEEEVRMLIEKEGNFKGNLILRKGSKKEYFDFRIGAEGVEKSNISDLSEVENYSNFSLKEREFISLNELLEGETEVIYESNSHKMIGYLPYAFSLVLIFIIVVLLWEKF
ncbi:MAG: hypothetical protein WC494_03840 [Candidatus Pacearchaeota archaeon]